MSPKQFRIRDVLINLPAESSESAQAGMCAEAPSVVGCIDGESLICDPKGVTRFRPTVTLCLQGGISPICGGTPTVPTVCGGITITTMCGPRTNTFCGIFSDCIVSFTICGGVTNIDPLTPVIDGVNTPVITQRVVNAPDLPTLKQELRHIMEVLDTIEQPSLDEDLAAVEERLNQALEEVRARRKGSK